MNDKVFMKEKKSDNVLLSIIAVALITSISSSAFTYVIMDNKSNGNVNNTQSSSNVKYDIQQVDNPVVAIADKCSPSIVGVTVKYVTQTLYGTLDDAGSEGSGIIYTADGYIITN